MEIPSEFGPRVERADPISGDYFKSGAGGGVNRIFREGVLFPAFARSSTDPTGFFQRVDAEAQDATELVASGTAHVSLQAAGRRLINDVQVARVFTPNGDGANDLLEGRFVLLRMLADRRLDIAFYDLAGALRGRTGSNLGRAGQWNFAWDGRDEHGQLVPPGIYLCRIKIAADREPKRRSFQSTWLIKSSNVAVIAPVLSLFPHPRPTPPSLLLH